MSDNLKSQSVTSKTPFPEEDISRRILTIRGQRVMLDADLAEVYGVSTKRLNEQVKRNTERFPEDFAFRLTEEEKTELVANCDRFDRLKHSTASPLAFTEHGAIMAASVLNSKRASKLVFTSSEHLFGCAKHWQRTKISHIVWMNLKGSMTPNSAWSSTRSAP